MTEQTLQSVFHSVSESQPGPRLREMFDNGWPSYRRWFRRGEEKPARTECEAALRQHMPEMADLHAEILGCVGGGDEEARFLSLFCPTPVVRGCSQAIWRDRESSALVRNYDHAPHLCDSVLLHTEWQGRAVIGSVDCLWGLLDGINEDGLCAALAFGGHPATGVGFGAALAVRCVLQTCTTVKEAAALLSRLPIHMPYNFALLDAVGDHATVHVAPGKATRVTKACASANHQGQITWPVYAGFVQTLERQHHIERCLGTGSLADLIGEFLKPPLFRSAYQRGSGTLYTAVLKPADRSATYLWPGQQTHLTFSNFPETEIEVEWEDHSKATDTSLPLTG